MRLLSVTISVAPLTTTVVPARFAKCWAIFTRSPVTPCESTPLTDASAPARIPISPALPLRIVIFSSSSKRCALSVLNRVAPAPTGSRITGIRRSFAIPPASSIDSICPLLSVPILRTSAPAKVTISQTSSGASAMTGAAPTEIVILAQSLTVT